MGENMYSTAAKIAPRFALGPKSQMRNRQYIEAPAQNRIATNMMRCDSQSGMPMVCMAT